MRSLFVVLILVAGSLAGCSTPAIEEPVPSTTPAPNVAVADVITMLEPVRLGAASFGAEPNIEVAPDNTIYVTTPVSLWRSDDGGVTYAGVGTPACAAALGFIQDPCPPGYETHEPGLDGGGDGAIASDAQGRLYWAGLFGNAGTVPFQYSDDRGESWSKAIDAAQDQSGDREWIDVADEMVWINWRDGGQDDGVWVARSLDRGANWEDPLRVTDDHIGGPIVHDVVTGNLYIPLVGFDATIRIAASADDGLSWQIHEVYKVPDGGQEVFRLLVTSIFPILDVDSAGRIHFTWAAASDPTLPKQAERPAVFYTYSDNAETWAPPTQITPSDRSSLFPWIAAGADGAVALAWYQNQLGNPSENSPDLWDVWLAINLNAPGGEWQTYKVNKEPIHAGSVCTSGTGCLLTAGDRSLLDFFEIAITMDGRPVVAYATDAPAPYVDAIVWAGGVADGVRMW